MTTLDLNRLPSCANTNAEKKLAKLKKFQQKRLEKNKNNAFTMYRVAYKDYTVYSIGWL